MRQPTWKRADLTGQVEWAKLSPTPTFALSKPRPTSRKRLGIKYESEAHKHLGQAYKGIYVPRPWLVYYAFSSRRWCQPDGLIIDIPAGHITIVEAKYCHVADAWWQLVCLYLPVVSKMFGNELWTYSTVEIVKYYDPSLPCPQQPTLVSKPHPIPSGIFGVTIWRPK
jgi:hypothetical protein